jgi:hypothetical protein
MASPTAVSERRAGILYRAASVERTLSAYQIASTAT